MRRMLNRLPARRQIWPVYSAIVFIVFSWAIYHALYQTPSWLYYMNLTGMMVLYSYVLSYALLESLMVFAFLGVICLILPARFFKERFVAVGLVLVTILAIIFILFYRIFDRLFILEVWRLKAIPLVLLFGIFLITILLSRLLGHYPRAEDWIEAVADRLTIFSYIYIPLGVLGWLVVFIRNLV